MTSTRVHYLVTTSQHVQLFPNGCKFDTNTLFLGGGFLEKITLSGPGATLQSLELTIRDGLDATTLRPVIGPDPTAIDAASDRWRVTVTSNVVGNYGEVHSLGAPHASVTGLRPVVVTKLVSLPAIAVATPSFEIPIQMRMSAMAIYFQNTSGARDSITYGIHYVPHVSGGSRRRQFYRPGLTVKSQPAQANAPVL